MSDLYVSRRVLVYEGEMIFSTIRSQFTQLSGRDLIEMPRRKIDLEEICLALALQHREIRKENAASRED